MSQLNSSWEGSKTLPFLSTENFHWKSIFQFIILLTLLFLSVNRSRLQEAQGFRQYKANCLRREMLPFLFLINARGKLSRGKQNQIFLAEILFLHHFNIDFSTNFKTFLNFFCWCIKFMGLLRRSWSLFICWYFAQYSFSARRCYAL